MLQRNLADAMAVVTLRLTGVQMDQQISQSKVLAELSDLMRAMCAGKASAAEMDPQLLAQFAKDAGCMSGADLKSELEGCGVALERVEGLVGDVLGCMGKIDAKLDHLGSSFDTLNDSMSVLTEQQAQQHYQQMAVQNETNSTVGWMADVTKWEAERAEAARLAQEVFQEELRRSTEEARQDAYQDRLRRDRQHTESIKMIQKLAAGRGAELTEVFSDVSEAKMLALNCAAMRQKGLTVHLVHAHGIGEASFRGTRTCDGRHGWYSRWPVDGGESLMSLLVAAMMPTPSFFPFI
jgi:hypothetical protein